MIGPVVYLIIVLVMAGIVHLSTVLAMPWLAARDAFVRIGQVASDNVMVVISTEKTREILPYADPAVATAVCRFVLDRGPVRVRMPTGETPMTMIVLRKGAGIIHSLSDKAATQGVLEAVIATPQQMATITDLDSDDEVVQEIRVTSPDVSGLVILHALVPVNSERASVEQTLRAASCEPEILQD